MTLIWASFILPILLQIVLSQGSITGRITCDNELIFYADGTLKLDNSISTNANNWRESNEVTLPSDTQVYAVKCVDAGYRGGIIASFDNGIVTDGTWKCTDTLYPGWETVSFDDSDWPAAYKIGGYGMAPWNTQPQIDNQDNPQWIWTPNWDSEKPDADLVVYCRKSPDTQPTGTCFTKGKITGDNQLAFYADGDLIVDGSISGNADNWRVSDEVGVPSTTQVYAVKGVDAGVKAGIIASFDNGVVTDGSWKCTDTLYPGWETVSFDDSDWPAAYKIGGYGMAPWNTQPQIDNQDNPQWIWTPNWKSDEPDADLVVYCRKTVAILPDVPAGCTFSACGKCTKADGCGLGLVSGELDCGVQGTRSVVMRCCCRGCQGNGTGTGQQPPYLCRNVLPPLDDKETDPMCNTDRK